MSIIIKEVEDSEYLSFKKNIHTLPFQTRKKVTEISISELELGAMIYVGNCLLHF